MNRRPDAALRVEQVLETCLYAEELERCARFYEEVLGLQVIHRSGDRHAFFRCGDHQVFLLFNPALTSEGGDVPSHGARGPGHVAFGIDEEEIGSWKARLAAHGIGVEAEVEWPRGGCSLYLRDPAGNSVELAPRRIWGLDTR